MLVEHVLCVVPFSPSSKDLLTSLLHSVLHSKVDGHIAGGVKPSLLCGLPVTPDTSGMVTWSLLERSTAVWRNDCLAGLLAYVANHNASTSGDLLLSIEELSAACAAVVAALGTCTPDLASRLLVALHFLVSLNVRDDAGTATTDDNTDGGTALSLLPGLDLRVALENAWNAVMDVRPRRAHAMQALCSLMFHPNLFSRSVVVQKCHDTVDMKGLQPVVHVATSCWRTY